MVFVKFDVWAWKCNSAKVKIFLWYLLFSRVHLDSHYQLICVVFLYYGYDLLWELQCVVAQRQFCGKWTCRFFVQIEQHIPPRCAAVSLSDSVFFAMAESICCLSLLLWTMSLSASLLLRSVAEFLELGTYFLLSVLLLHSTL